MLNLGIKSLYHPLSFIANTLVFAQRLLLLPLQLQATIPHLHQTYIHLLALSRQQHILSTLPLLTTDAIIKLYLKPPQFLP